MPHTRKAFGRIALFYAMSSLWIVDPEVLITEVEARPLLYIKSLPDYGNKSLKNDAWVDVTKKFTENWDSLTTEEKNNRCKDIQAKWKHIRDNFRREYQAQKDDMTAQLEGRGAKEGAMAKWTKKRKKYRHYDQLSFLVPHIKDANTFCNYGTTRNVSESRISAPLNIESASTVSTAPLKVKQTSLRRKKTADPDEDTLFCLSLVQSLKKMDDDAKISTKIEILNTIRTFSNRSNYTHWQPAQPTLVHRQTTPQQYLRTTSTLTQDINHVKSEPTDTTPLYEQNICQASSGALPVKRIKIESYHCDPSLLTTQESRPHSANSFLHIFNPVSPSPPSSTITSPIPNVSSSEDDN